MTTYQKKLRDPRWIARRQEIIAKAKHVCEECGETHDNSRARGEGGLQVHHITYLRKREPWDYPDELLICLCESCHVNRQVSDEEAAVEFSRMIRRMPQWHVYELSKSLRGMLDEGWKPKLHDAYETMRNSYVSRRSGGNRK